MSRKDLQEKIDELREKDLVRVIYVKPITKLHQIIGFYNSGFYECNKSGIEVLPRYTFNRNTEEVNGTGSSGSLSCIIHLSDILDIEKLKSGDQMIEDFRKLKQNHSLNRSK